MAVYNTQEVRPRTGKGIKIVRENQGSKQPHTHTHTQKKVKNARSTRENKGWNTEHIEVLRQTGIKGVNPRGVTGDMSPPFRIEYPPIIWF